MALFDSTSSYEPLDHYKASGVAAGDALSMPETALYGTVAAVTDFGTSIWNSLMPEKYETSTADMLSKINQDALNVYNEHPDAIQTASFIGGIFAPAGLSFKLMGMARSGMKGMGYLSEAASVSRLKAAETAFAQAGPASAAYQAAQWSVYRGVVANAVVDSAAAELLILGAMNAHPYMEDYQKDLGKNFLIGTAIGGAVGSAFGGIIAKGTMREAAAKIEEPGVAALFKTLRQPEIEAGVSEYSHLGDALIVKTKAIEDLSTLIKEAEKGTGTVTYSPYVLETMKDVVKTEQAKAYIRLQEAAQGDLAKFLESSELADKAHIMNLVTSVENAGVDKISWAKVSDKLAASTGSGALSKTVKLFTRDIDAAGKEVIEKQDAFWSPLLGSYFGKADQVNYLTLADLGETVEQLTKKAKKQNFEFPRSDVFFERSVEHSARIDADYAVAYIAAQKMGAKDLAAIKVHPEDLATLKAVLVRAKELGLDDIKLAVTREKPSYEAVERAVLKRHGVSPTYGKDLRTLDTEWDTYSMRHPRQGSPGDVPQSLQDTISNWVAGSKNYLRDAVADYRFSKQTPGAQRVTELYNHPRSKALREELRKSADLDGNVWLYRGLKQEPGLHPAVESYTILPEKAAEFTKGYDKGVKLFKVKVDDILTGFRDIPEYGHKLYKPEILVMAPVRENVQISKANLSHIPQEILRIEDEIATAMNVTQKFETLSGIAAIEAQILAATKSAINDLKVGGFGLEAIAIRTGTPVEIIKKIAAGGDIQAGELIKYGSQLDIVQALETANRAIGLSTSLKKVPYAEMQANMHAAGLDMVSKDIVLQHMLTSPSTFVQDLARTFQKGDIRFLSDQLKLSIADFVGSKVKSTAWASANQVLSDMPEISAAATVLGKETIALKNAVKEQFEGPIARAMGSVLKDGAAQIEANTALNLNASLSGYRLYKEGQFWQFAKGVPRKVLREIEQLEGDDFLRAVQTETKKGSGIPIGEAATFRGTAYTVKDANVDGLLKELQTYGRHMYGMKDAYSKAIGRGSFSDIGFWVPAVNIGNKEIAYVHDMMNDKVTMLYAKTAGELVDGIAEFRKSAALQGRTVEIVTKDQQKYFNALKGRHDPMYQEMADVSARHSGASAATFVATDASQFQEILGGYNYYVNRGIDDLVQLQLSPVMDHLKVLSEVSQTGYNPNKPGILQKLSSKPVDPGSVLKNIILGYPNLREHQHWSELQQRGQVITDKLLEGITNAFAPVLGKQVRTAEQWTQITKDMEARGIVNPYKVLGQMDPAFALERYLAEGKAVTQELTPRAISLMNGLVATSLLRFMELGQPLVNALSLPILTSGAVNRKMAASFLGEAIDPNAKFTVQKVMYDGVRLMNHPTEGARIAKIGESLGIFSAELRNVTELMEHTRSLDPGLMKKAEDMLESSLVKLLSKPSDYSESMVRKVSFFNGWVLGKQAYPGLGDKGLTTFARAFMDEAVGNYTAAQRPAMFQGTFGVGFGLFQTYMLTLAQQLFRGVQNRDWSSLGKQMLTQATIFGGASLPGFHLVSEQIGKHFSDQHFDLQTGTFRAIGDPAATLLIYGLPTMIGPGISTRGDIQPRLPNPFQGLDSVAVANIVGQAFTAGERVASAAWHADESAGRAVLEALSLQSVSRPVARLSELISGNSLTSRGDLVATNIGINNTDNLLSQSTLARIFATRPVEEIKARETLQLNTFYRAYDSDKRKAVTSRLKAHIRAGDANQETLEELQQQYLRTGHPSGWRSAVREAFVMEGGGATASIKKKLGPESPLNLMVEDLD